MISFKNIIELLLLVTILLVQKGHPYTALKHEIPDSKSDFQSSSKTLMSVLAKTDDRIRPNFWSTMNIVCNNTLECSNWTVNEASRKDDTFFMSISKTTAAYFMYTVRAGDYNLMRLKLIFHSRDVREVQYSRCVIQPQNWVWTFKGKGGAHQYLYWPIEYSMLSLGLLDAKTRSKDFYIDINVHGNCPVVIGDKNTTLRIGLALINMVTSNLGHHEDKYNYSYFCYKSKFFMGSKNLYRWCLQTICPIEAIVYSCCKTKWNVTSQNWITTCPGHYHYYDAMWWIYPFAIGVILCLFSPVLIMRIASVIYLWNRSIVPSTHRTTETNQLLQDQSRKETDWISENPVTICRIVLKPFRYLSSLYPNFMTKLFLVTVSLSSMSFVGLKILLYRIYDRDYAVSAVQQGSPMDFVTVLAGFYLSKRHFLSDFGGPFVACGVYIVSLVIMLCIPSDLSTFLSKGLPDSSSKSVSPLCIDRATKERLGSMFFRHNGGGFTLIYNTMVIHFFLLLNPSFWGYAILKQFQRYGMITRLLAGNDVILLFIVKTLFTPFYILFCIVEVIVCVLYYGVPVVFFSLTAFRAYCCPVWRKVRTSRSYLKLFASLFVLVEICVLLFVLYIFSIVFLVSFLFLSRIAIFTYTGLFVYPRFSYGYIIFSLTVLMYVLESVTKIDKVYSKLFKQSVLVCEEYQTNNEYPTVVFKKKDADTKVIPRKLFYEIVKRHEPIRVNMFKILIKITLLIIVLYISVELLISFEKFGELSVLTQALVTLFVCMIPKLANFICSYAEEDVTREEKQNQYEIIRNFIKSELSAEQTSVNNFIN